MQEKFNLLMEKYNKLSLSEKKDNLINEVKEMIAVYTYLAEVNKVDFQLLKTKEILDINNKEDDYFEALYAYFNILKEVISKLLEDKYF